MLLKTFRSIVADMKLYTNCYLVVDEATKEGILIDTIDKIDKIYNHIENGGVKLKYIILTHCHADHIAGLKELKKNYPNVKIVIHEFEKAGLTDDEVNLTNYIDAVPNYIDADVTVKDGDVIKLGELDAKIIHTPGHTKGSISILIDDALFSGDTLFREAWGRTDLPTSNFNDIISSIEKKLMVLPENTVVYPGHGLATMIGEERWRYLGEN